MLTVAVHPRVVLENTSDSHHNSHRKIARVYEKHIEKCILSCGLYYLVVSVCINNATVRGSCFLYNETEYFLFMNINNYD